MAGCLGRVVDGTPGQAVVVDCPRGTLLPVWAVSGMAQGRLAPGWDIFGASLQTVS